MTGWLGAKRLGDEESAALEYRNLGGTPALPFMLKAAPVNEPAKWRANLRPAPLRYLAHESLDHRSAGVSADCLSCQAQVWGER